MTPHATTALVVVDVQNATDFGVASTVMDAWRLGYGATVIADACRATEPGGSLARAWAEMGAAGVRRATTADILGN